MTMRFKTSVCVGAVVLMIGPATLGAATGDSRLADAMKRRDKQAVHALLKQGAPVDGTQPDGATALHWAVHESDLEIVDALVRAGAKVDAATDLGATPLSLACTNANAAIVERLIAAGANVNTAVTSGETPLMTCARVGSLDAVGKLLAAGAAVNTKEPWQGQNALMWAASQGHPAIMQALIAKGADVKAASKNGFTALHFAARQGGKVDAAKMLLTAGAGINEKAKDGSTPLLVATVRGHVPLSLFLLEQGADPNIADAGFTPLHWASGTFETRLTGGPHGYSDPMSGIQDRAEKIALIKALLARGANPNAQAARNLPRFGSTSFRQPLAGATPFFLASYSTDVEVMRLLVAAGADPNLPTKNKTTPLMAAAGLNRVQGESPVTEKDALAAVSYILELGANAAEVNDIGENALHGVAYLGWKSLFQLLVDKGAPVNAVTKQGLTPYIIATGHGDRAISTTVVYHKDLAEMLLKMGADPKLGTGIE
jgi:ankyrin repeat protein